MKSYGLIGFVVVAFIMLGYQKLAFYVRFDFNFILLLMVLPFVIRKQSQQKSLRYGVLALALFLLYPFAKLSSIYFLAFICSLFFLYESQFGKLTSIPLFLILVVSPVAIFLSEIIGFEIRLWLTNIAGKFLFLVDKGYSSVGNIILLNDEQFHVDPECMGLKMVLLSLFVTLVFLSYKQQKSKQNIAIYNTLGMLMLTYVLVILSNLSRIILITLLKAAPHTLAHQLIGIVCFVFYVIIPMGLIINKLPTKALRRSVENKQHAIKPAYRVVLTLLVFIFLLVYRFSDIDKKTAPTIQQSELNIALDDFKCSIEDHGVLKASNEEILLYIKPAVGFYSAEHSPIICWKGSGYKVTKEQIIALAGYEVYYSELIQDDAILYTTWWYDSGEDKTISQFRWRKQSFIEGTKYHLVNIISGDKETLFDHSTKLLSNDLFPK